MAPWLGRVGVAGRGREGGWAVYLLYRAVSYGVSPLAHLLLRWRRLRGLEHPVRWRERLGRPSSSRPPARPLLWFHAVSLGEGLAAIPVIRHCLLQQQQHPSHAFGPFTILMTTTTVSAFDVIDAQLPNGVIHQFAPIDTPRAVDDFIGYWNPSAIFLMESELWPNLILSAVRKGIAVALLNARMSAKSFKLWSGPVALPLISLMLSKLSLIASLSTVEAIRFQLLQAPPFIINFAGNLKYAAGGFHVPEEENRKLEVLKLQLSDRPVWMASSVHRGEEDLMVWIHKELVKLYPNLVTIIVPREPLHGRQITPALRRAGLDVVLRSQTQKISRTTDIYIVDTLGELKHLYRITPIAVIGGSFLPNLAGHNISEAAAMGCAVLTGPHVGHFSHMVLEMLRLEPLSVWQVSGKLELLEAVKKLLGNAEYLEAHRSAAKRAFSAVSTGVTDNVWDLISAYVFKPAHLNLTEG